MENKQQELMRIWNILISIYQKKRHSNISDAEYNAINYERDEIIKKYSTLEIPEGITSINEGMFSQCNTLKKLIIPSTLKVIPKYCFRECKKLREVELRNGIQEISNAAFDECSSLNTINFPKSLKVIEGAFYKCNSLITIVLPEGLTRLKSSFFDCKSLKKVYIPSTLKEWDGAFMSCSSLNEVILADGLNMIDKSSFLGCGIETINIPSSVTTIKDGAFASCTNLKEVILNEGLKKIESGAFVYCDSLKILDIPFSVKDINDAFVHIDRRTNKKQWTRVDEKTKEQHGTILEQITVPIDLYIQQGSFLPQTKIIRKVDVEKKKRIKKYWEEHLEEKKTLEKELVLCYHKQKENEEKIAQIEKKNKELADKRKSIAFYKFKTKEEIDKQIAQNSVEISALISKRKSIRYRINEINNIFIQDRK